MFLKVEEESQSLPELDRERQLAITGFEDGRDTFRAGRGKKIILSQSSKRNTGLLTP